MADASDKTDDRWTIRGVDNETRSALMAAAKREDVTIGEWLNRHGRILVQSDKARPRLPAVVRPPVGPPTLPADTPPPSVPELAEAVARVAGLEGAPKATIATMWRLLRDRARADRLALAGQTRPAVSSDNSGQTVRHAAE